MHRRLPKTRILKTYPESCPTGMRGKLFPLVSSQMKKAVGNEPLEEESRNSLRFTDAEGSVQCLQHLPFVPILRHTNPVHSLPFYFFQSYFNVILSCMSGTSK